MNDSELYVAMEHVREQAERGRGLAHMVIVTALALEYALVVIVLARLVS